MNEVTWKTVLECRQCGEVRALPEDGCLNEVRCEDCGGKYFEIKVKESEDE